MRGGFGVSRKDRCKNTFIVLALVQQENVFYQAGRGTTCEVLHGELSIASSPNTATNGDCITHLSFMLEERSVSIERGKYVQPSAGLFLTYASEKALSFSLVFGAITWPMLVYSQGEKKRQETNTPRSIIATSRKQVCYQQVLRARLR